MTGRHAGVGVQLKESCNQHLVHIHCMAHQLALVSSQSANGVSYLKTYQEFMTNLYYWFKHSANRIGALSHLQDVLDSPKIRIKEVHSVRWFSFYNALEAVHKCWQPLGMLFEQNVSSKNDPKSKGFLKTMATSQFLIVTNMLMDVIPILTHLSMVFQKENLDLSVVGPAVNGVRDQLNKLLENKGTHEKGLLDELNQSEKSYMGLKITDSDQLRSSADKARKEFITNLLSQLEKRFPADAQTLVSSLAVLGVRGIRFKTQEERRLYGTEQIDHLVSHYGGSYIDGEVTKQEWVTLKELLYNEHYSYSQRCK